MASINFCPVTSELRALLHEGRRQEAVALATERLRAGYSSPQFLAIVADLLSPGPRKRGGQRHLTPRWMEIGEAFTELQDRGVTYEAAVLHLASQFKRAERTIETVVADYRKARDTRN